MAAPGQSSRGAAGTKSAVWQTLLFTGGALAIVAAAAFYVVLGAPSPGEILARLRGEPAIARGFIGMANFGHWRLICMPGPAPLNGLTPPAAGSDTPKAATSSANACRINQEMPAPQDKADAGSQPAKVLIATNFSLIGAKRTPAAMLRLPATAQPGDTITLRFDDGATVKTMVRDCAAAECLATGALSEADWNRLASAKSLQVTFPVAGRQWVLLDLPVEGLAMAIAALARAENPPRG
jgi:invasion protein IalB